MNIGSIGWIDLTVADAESVRDFYAKVVGWNSSPVDMGGYADYTMEQPNDGKAIAGICHARGANAEIPPAWMMYIVVKDLDQGTSTCLALGGKVVMQPRSMGDARYCMIRDPAGAVCALYQPAE